MELILRTKQNRHEYKKLETVGWIAAIAVAAVIILLLFTLVLFALGISDNGMEPSLQKGDVILFSRTCGFVRAPRRSDIVAFRMNNTIGIGRVVALPGEQVSTYHGKIFINSFRLDETAYTTGDCPEFAAFSIPEGSYLVLPDIRTELDFSNPASFIVPGNNVTGSAFFRVSPIGRAVFFG